MRRIKYDRPIEVSAQQHAYLSRTYAGTIAHRTEGERYYIKVWIMRYAKDIKTFLNYYYINSLVIIKIVIHLLQ